MLCPIKRLGLEQCGSTALGDLSCKMKAGTSDLLLTNEREGVVIYGANWGKLSPCFITEMLCSMAAAVAAPQCAASARHLPAESPIT